MPTHNIHNRVCIGIHYDLVHNISCFMVSTRWRYMPVVPCTGKSIQCTRVPVIDFNNINAHPMSRNVVYPNTILDAVDERPPMNCVSCAASDLYFRILQIMNIPMHTIGNKDTWLQQMWDIKEYTQRWDSGSPAACTLKSSGNRIVCQWSLALSTRPGPFCGQGQIECVESNRLDDSQNSRHHIQIHFVVASSSTRPWEKSTTNCNNKIISAPNVDSFAFVTWQENWTLIPGN